MKTAKKALQVISKWYIFLSYMLILPVIFSVLLSSLDASLDASDFEKWDQQATAVIIECKDVTHRSSRGENENGGSILSYKLTARYKVNGKDYLISTTCGTHYRVGEQVVISYNSQDPSDNYWSDDPVAEYMRMKQLHTASVILLILLIPGCLWGASKLRKRKKKDKLPS